MNIARTLLLVAATACAACNRTDDLRFRTIRIDRTLGTPPAVEVSYSFVSIVNADRNPSLQTIERADVNRVFGLEEFPGTPREAARIAIEELSADLLPAAQTFADEHETPYFVTVETEAERVDTLLTYAIRRIGYTGGAHGYDRTEYRTYALDGGYEVTLTDLLGNTASERLVPILRQKLYDRYGVANDEELAAQGFFPEMIRPTENFRVLPDGGVLFRYNPYDIACYAAGPVELTLTRAEFDSLRRE